MASSESKALGTLSKFVGAFESAGGTFQMLNWLAESPKLMKAVVEVANQYVLDHRGTVTIKITDEGQYNPAEFFRPGEHHGVLISEVDERIAQIAVNELRPVRTLTLVSYVARKDCYRGNVDDAAHDQLGRVLEVSIDHLRQALLHARDNPGKILAVNGEVNEFRLPYAQWYCSIQAVFLRDKGWKLTLGDKGDNGEVSKGTRFILSGNPIPGKSSLFA